MSKQSQSTQMFSSAIDKALEREEAKQKQSESSFAASVYVRASDDPYRSHKKKQEYKSKKKSRQAEMNPGMSAWREATRELGYMQKGAAFKRIPSRDSAEYKQLMERKQQIEMERELRKRK